MPRKTKTQRQIILKLLQEGIKVTPMMALNTCGCFRLSAVIFDLRKDGHNIKTNKTKSYTGNNYAEYVLV
jgi:hypothetical protein